MQSVSANYERLQNSQDKWYETQLAIDGVGTYGEDKLFAISSNVEMFHGYPKVGTAVSGEIELKLIAPSATIPTMAKLRPQTRACGTAAKSSKVTMTGGNLASSHATYSSGNITFDAQSGAEVVGTNLSFAADSTEYVESEWLPQGVYYIDTREVTANQDGLDVLTIHGYDAMLKAEQDYASNAVIGDNYDTAYVLAIAGQMGVEVDPRTWDIMGAGHIITFPLGYSCREILGYIAGIDVGCFVMTDEGKLRLISLLTLPPETNLLVDSEFDVLVFGTDSILV
jgi:hypothetical protein